MKTCRLVACSAAAIAALAGSAAAQNFVQSFDDITLLSGLGWSMQNRSAPLGTTDWFQGNPATFAPYASAGYIGANFNNTSGAGTISNWLLTPTTTLSNGDQLRFWTRRPAETEWADRLEVRMSTAGSSTNVGLGATTTGDFTTLLLTINPNLIWTEYPGEWTAYTVTVSGLAMPTTGRFALRYFVEDAGPAGTHGDYIGIDEVQFAVGGITTGACCFASGACDVMTQHECGLMAGTFLGAGTDCSACAPAAQGACCLPNGACSVGTHYDCTIAGGVYFGDNSACGACPTEYVYTGGTVLIPDGTGAHQCGDPLLVPLTVGDSFTVGAVHVGLHIQHTWQGDVTVTLRHIPSNTSALIIDRPGLAPGGFGFDTDDFGTFTSPFRSTDTALFRYNLPDRTTGLTPATGSWRPDNPLSVFEGVDSAGEWRLEVRDCYTGDTGFLHGWRLWLEEQSGPACYANCDNSTVAPVLNVDDFTCFINNFASASALPHAQQVAHYANCDQSTVAPALNVDDFTCFINQFAQGCP